MASFEGGEATEARASEKDERQVAERVNRCSRVGLPLDTHYGERGLASGEMSRNVRESTNTLSRIRLENTKTQTVSRRGLCILVSHISRTSDRY